ncbi:MAG: LysM peptidoglycan-binding domain-containing protein [Cytophagales bacterium]
MNKHCVHINFIKTLFLLIFFGIFTSEAEPFDSIGIEVKDGKKYIKHKIESGETLFRLTKKYGVSIDELKKVNPELEKGLKLGSVIRIPKNTGSKSAETKSEISQNDNYHTVVSGEGLTAIAKKYNMTLDELMKLNSLTDKNVKIGQKLKVNKPKEEVNSKPTLHEEIKNTSVKVSKPSKSTSSKLIDTLNVKKYKKFEGGNNKNFQTGIASVILDDKGDSFEALYNDCEVGQFINVKNLQNDERVFVKVVGKLTNNSDDKLIIQLSPKAMERLQSSDTKIAVEVSYIAP